MANEDRVPPQSLEMEQACLGAMLTDKRAIASVARILKPEDFYREAHQVVYGEIVSLWQADTEVDLLTMQEALRKRDQLEPCGGSPYLLHLIDTCPAVANAEFYARVVSEKAVCRQIMQAAKDIHRKAHLGEYEEIDHLAAFCVTRVTESVQRVGVAKEPVSSEAEAEALKWRLIERQQNPHGRQGAPVPIAKINSLLGTWQKKQLHVIMARPSMGKTSAAIGAAVAAGGVGVGTFVFSLEMSAEQLTDKVVSTIGRVSLGDIKSGGFESTVDASDAERARMRYGRMPLWIDDSTGASAADMARRIEQWRSSHPVDFVIIDHLNLIAPSKRCENRTIELGDTTRRLKEMAKKLNIAVLLLCQLSREIDKRPDRRPVLSDIRGSGEVEENIDTAIGLYRPDYYKADEERAPGDWEPAEWIILKNRDGAQGAAKCQWSRRWIGFADDCDDPAAPHPRAYKDDDDYAE